MRLEQQIARHNHDSCRPQWLWAESGRDTGTNSTDLPELRFQHRCTVALCAESLRIKLSAGYDGYRVGLQHATNQMHLELASHRPSATRQRLSQRDANGKIWIAVSDERRHPPILIVQDGHTIYMGKDKYENEDLIRYGIPEDVWFHVDNLSSAHVYLRMNRGEKV